ncbi:dual specificity phosphatase, catalytic domain-containing protein [Ditylenchus destructor]|uniref:Dual specificity phosphatase, catalytic domain-containing protein n=1 Tax=Ditylenchus destructor TaxID=166010 RepID=A0AAD4N924_9BILA|nr:dual specificity phosphatase, catalytic domain-containing protein [Ditylenchus destructor]
MNGSNERKRHHHTSKFAMGSENKRWQLPKGWLDYAPVGRDIPEIRMVPFKTPLEKGFFDQMRNAEENRFEVNTLIEYAEEAGKTLGLVIDLTDTTRYYTPDLWYEHGVEHLKLRCPGHELHNYDNTVNVFIETVKDFLVQNKDNEKLVGVHCTHGLNRTGYMICRYMIECLGLSADEAIEKFESSRGYKMERQAYISALHKVEQKLRNKKASEGSKDPASLEYISLPPTDQTGTSTNGTT